jgi:hypothetical protein
VTTWGGNTPQSLVNHLCDEIAAEPHRLALVAGAEAVATIRALGKLGVHRDVDRASATPTSRAGGDAATGTSDLESAPRRA